MTKDEALKLAQDYLLSKQMGAHIIAAIREALAHAPTEREQPEQHTEPCGWRMKHNGEWAYSFTEDAWDFIRIAQPAQPAQQQEPVACKSICELCVKRGYNSCANAAQTTPIPVPQPAQQQEPVGEVFGYYERGFTEQKTLYGKLHNQDLPVGAKLYTSPPARKPWVGLTEEEMGDFKGGYQSGRIGSFVGLLAAIEAKLKEKNT